MKTLFNSGQVSERIKYIIVTIYVILILLTSFLFNSPQEIIQGMKNIVLAPSVLVSDYFVVGNVGAALFNASLLMIITVVLAIFNNLNINGPIIAGIFTVGGFALFGKNIYNFWAILFGVYLYSAYKGEKFGNNLIIALFGTALAPLISLVSFGFGLDPVIGIIFGNLCGIIAGFSLVPLAYHYKKFHLDYDLYNLGFTAGIVGTLFMALFRSFGLESQSLSLIAAGYNRVFTIYCIIMFLSMIVIGFICNGLSFKGYKDLLKSTGKSPNDFVQLNGFGISFINMGIMGLIMLAYILLVGGEINGPGLGALFTVIGFSAFGKHPRNAIPITIGVFIGSMGTKWEVNSTSMIFAATFGTALAPVAGDFGVIAGIVAGFLHVSVVTNVGYLHGGVNLYNNGFSAGIVAAILAPFLMSIKKRKRED
ncbi:MAG: DUF1576 domain-containing protein [Tissierella sp.]|nr:DUF1576 domain-containing protein [Tissierella sp.]